MERHSLSRARTLRRASLNSEATLLPGCAARGPRRGERFPYGRLRCGAEFGKGLFEIGAQRQ